MNRTLSASKRSLIFISAAVVVAVLLLVLSYSNSLVRVHADATSTLSGTVVAATTTSTSTQGLASSTLQGMLSGMVSSTSMGTSTGTTTTNDIQALIARLQGLQTDFPSFTSLIQSWINQLLGMGTSTGTTTPPVVNPMEAHIDQDGWDVMAGGSIDFGGHNFGHEEDVSVTLGGIQITKAHADGGGNFSTGSVSLPKVPGTYTYLFTAQNSGIVVSATLNVH